MHTLSRYFSLNLTLMHSFVKSRVHPRRQFKLCIAQILARDWHARREKWALSLFSRNLEKVILGSKWDKINIVITRPKCTRTNCNEAWWHHPKYTYIYILPKYTPPKLCRKPDDHVWATDFFCEQYLFLQNRGAHLDFWIIFWILQMTAPKIILNLSILWCFLWSSSFKCNPDNENSKEIVNRFNDSWVGAPSHCCQDSSV